MIEALAPVAVGRRDNSARLPPGRFRAGADKQCAINQSDNQQALLDNERGVMHKKHSK